jgi:hypothetical protein
MGWGAVEVTHERDTAGELFILKREINTAEVLGEIVAAGGTIVSLLAIVL